MGRVAQARHGGPEAAHARLTQGGHGDRQQRGGSILARRPPPTLPPQGQAPRPTSSSCGTNGSMMKQLILPTVPSMSTTCQGAAAPCRVSRKRRSTPRGRRPAPRGRRAAAWVPHAPAARLACQRAAWDGPPPHTHLVHARRDELLSLQVVQLQPHQVVLAALAKQAVGLHHQRRLRHPRVGCGAGGGGGLTNRNVLS